MNRKTTLLISILILLTGFAATYIIFSTEPVAEQGGATKQTAMLVDVVEVQRADHTPVIQATGIVRPSQEISLSPRVSGEITEISEAFTPGGFVKKGERLIQIDPADYEIALLQEKSGLRQAESALQVEMGLQKVAQREYELLDDTLSNDNKELLLRKPQLNAARANVEQARANVRRAELDLERTTVRAPFNAHIVNRNANLGSQVSPGQDLAWLLGDDMYWVEATVPVSKLKWLSFTEESDGSKVMIRNRTAWDEGIYREGTLQRMIGALQDQTRMARVLVEVDDPLSRKEENRNSPPLMVGEFVQTRIMGTPLENVVRVDRDLVRDGNTVWVMDNKKLSVRPVTIVFQDAEFAYISEGISNGDSLVTTNLATVADGAALRVEGDEPGSTE